MFTYTEKFELSYFVVIIQMLDTVTHVQKKIYIYTREKLLDKFFL